ncbi:MAG: pentapeptide repeat-containing protein [Bacteroidales bacterium]
MDLKTLSADIKLSIVEDRDLSSLNLEGLDFSGITLKNINFKGNKLERVLFENASLENCDFDATILSQVSFKKCKLISCRFRNAKIYWSDFRYAEVSQITLEGAKIDYCDFYRTFFMGVGIFRKTRISNSSLYYTYFDEGSTLRKENIVDNKILQQDKDNYEKFLTDWNLYGTGVRTNNQQCVSDWSPMSSLRSRYADAEDIYKNLNGLWTSKGFLSDSNWAYVQGKRMERYRMFSELLYEKNNFYIKIKKVLSIIMNFFLDMFFGYGESMRKMIFTYIVVVCVFAYIFYASNDVSVHTYLRAIGISFKNMVAITSDEVSSVSPFIDFLNVVQTTIGILLTGIFGFILGNKIRNQ